MGNINVSNRPLTSGMITDTSPTQIPQGGFVDVNGFIVRDGQLRHRPFWQRLKVYDLTYSTADQTVLDYISYPVTSESVRNFAVTRTGLFLDEGDAFTAETIPTAGGDTTPFTWEPTCGVQYTIGRDSSGTAMWMSDGSTSLKKYDGTTWTEPSVGVTTSAPRSVKYHDSRLFIAGPTTATGNQLIWSDLNDPDTFGVASYVYFPERSQPITRIESMGRFLVLFFPDAIYIGQQSGRPDIPYTFSEINMSNVGLIGFRGYTRWKNGFFFVANSGTYYLRPDRIVEPVQCHIWSEFREWLNKESQFSVVSLGNKEDIYIGLPGRTFATEKIVYYNSESKAWSYWNTDQDLLCTGIDLTTLVWDDGIVGFVVGGTRVTTWADFSDVEIDSWDDMGVFSIPYGIVTFRRGKFYGLSDSTLSDDWEATNYRTTSVLEFGDLDFNEPDMVKTFHRLGLRTDIDYSTYNVLLTLEGSNDGGQNYTTIFTDESTLNVEEKFAHFRFTGAECRFRLTFKSLSQPYNVYGISFRVRGRGLETP